MLSRALPSGSGLALAWGRLPRDTRDTLFLLGVITWVLLPQATRLPLWCSLLTTALLAWRAHLAVRQHTLPGLVWRAALLALGLAGTVWSHRTLLGRDAGVTLIVLLLALKTLELRARRDAFVVFFLGFFALLTQFFFSQSLATAAAMLLGLMGLLTALVQAHLMDTPDAPDDAPRLAQAAAIAGRLALWGTPLMLLLFLLFPRLGPLWGLPGDAHSGRSGLSERMQVGQIAQLALDDRVALRVRFDGRPPPPQDLYFRGPVLSHFDGREWQPGRATFGVGAAELRVAGPAVGYELTLEPGTQPWLLLLDASPDGPQLPPEANVRARMTRELQWQAQRPLTELLRYRAQSHPRFQHGPLQHTLALQEFLELPPGYNPRTLALAAELRRDPALAQADARQLTRTLLQRLRDGGYQYTLEPGLYGPHSADEFWFERKAGFCEHIASAFVLLMRALDVPARVVTGFQGGELNGTDSHWVVRHADAHAWAEVWQPGEGWLRVDPTSAVAPGRVGELARLQAPRGLIETAFGTMVGPSLLAQWRSLWDAVNHRWNQWVLNHSQGRQFELLRALGVRQPDWDDLAWLLAAALLLVSLGLGAWQAWPRRPRDPWLRLLQQARGRLARAGLASGPGTAPRRLANALRQAPPPGCPPAQAQALADWLLRLEALRYAAPPPGRTALGPAGTPAQGAATDLATLRREFRQLTWPTPST